MGSPVVARDPLQEVVTPIGGSIYALVTMTITIECPVSAEPLAHISWYHNNSLLSDRSTAFQDKTTDALIIPKLNTTNEGEYKCVATNSMGRDIASSQVNLLRK